MPNNRGFLEKHKNKLATARKTKTIPDWFPSVSPGLGAWVGGGWGGADRPSCLCGFLAPGFRGPEHAQECCACTRDLLCIHKRFFYTQEISGVDTRDFL